MEKFTPYDKLSKKKKRELDARNRRDWGGLRPVTRRSENPKAYNRKKARNWRDESDTAPFVLGVLPVLRPSLSGAHISQSEARIDGLRFGFIH